MLTQISALATAAAGAELHNLWRKQHGRDVVAITAWLFSFPQLQGSHLQLLLFSALMNKNFIKKLPQLNSTQPKKYANPSP